MQNWGEQTERRNREEVRRLRSLLMLFFAFQTGSDFYSDSELQTLAVRRDMCWMSGRNIIRISLLTRKLRRAHEGCSWDAWATTPMSTATTFSRFGVSITQHFKKQKIPPSSPSVLIASVQHDLSSTSSICPIGPTSGTARLLGDQMCGVPSATRHHLSMNAGSGNLQGKGWNLGQIGGKKPIRMGSNLKKHHGFWDFPPPFGVYWKTTRKMSHWKVPMKKAWTHWAKPGMPLLEARPEAGSVYLVQFYAAMPWTSHRWCLCCPWQSRIWTSPRCGPAVKS